MARRRYVYLGKRVRDVKRKGYDTAKEGKAIARAILSDYRRGRISKRKAVSRLNLLELVTKKNKKLSRSQKKAVRNYIDKVIRPKISGKRRKRRRKRK